MREIQWENVYFCWFLIFLKPMHKSKSQKSQFVYVKAVTYTPKIKPTEILSPDFHYNTFLIALLWIGTCNEKAASNKNKTAKKKIKGNFRIHFRLHGCECFFYWWQWLAHIVCKTGNFSSGIAAKNIIRTDTSTIRITTIRMEKNNLCPQIA